MRKISISEPWLHQASGFWCKKIAGQLRYLDHDYQVAKRKLAALLRERQRVQARANTWLDRSVAELCDEFLDDIKARRAPTTYDGYRYRLLRALRAMPPALRVGEIRRFHLAKIEQSLVNKCSPTTIRDTIATLQCAFEWAVRIDVLDSNPLRGYAKPAARSRNRIITRDEFQSLLRATARNPAFRRFLIALRRTGCRPKELRTLTWSMVDLEQGLWILPKHKTITTQKHPRPRIIPLPPCVLKLCRWLAARRDERCHHVFLNAIQRPYSKDRLVKIMDRVRDRAGIAIKADERIVLYSTRHSYGTEATGKVSDIELAELMGHTTTATTRRYIHLNAARLRDIQRRAERPGPVQENA
ncbi:MAG: tyrosine-type recombinase/integrase [Pirellulales bacterium]